MKLKTPPYFSDEKKSSRTEWFRFQKNEIISGKMYFYFNTTSYEKQKFTTGQWFVTSVALSFPQFTSGTWNLVKVFFLGLKPLLKTFREQARSQSKGLSFDNMILWQRNLTEKKLPKILFLPSRSCCSFAFLANITIGPGAWDTTRFFEVPTRLGNYCGFLQIKSQCLGTPVDIIDMAHHWRE